MPLTLLHQFYKIAKEIPEKPFVHFKIKNSYHAFPWWLYKSKVKHFSLGLIHRGFQPNDTFLICAPNCPEWIYTEMALFTLGAVSVTCVERLEEENLLKLIQETKASGILIGWPSLLDRFARIKEKMPSLKSILATNEMIQSKYPELKLTTFREVFNEGVQHEDKFRTTYWKLRDARKPTDLATLFYQIRHGMLQLVHSWSYQEIQNFTEQLRSQGVDPFRKQILNLSPLSHIDTRLVGLYLPIFQRGTTAFLSEEENILEACAYSKPHFIFVSEIKKDPLFHEILRQLDQQNSWIKKIQNWRYLASRGPLGSLKRRIGKKLFSRQVQKILGGRIRQILFEGGKISEEFRNLLEGARIKIIKLSNPPSL